jgi:hypothetical protein
MKKKKRKGPTTIIEDNYFLVTNKHFKTQSHKKLWRYVEEVVDSDSFKEDVSNLRQLYKIPEGIVSNEKAQPMPPLQWADHDNAKKVRMLMDDVDALCYKYGLPCFELHDTFLNQIFFDGPPVKFEDNFMAYNLCNTQDIIGDREDPWSDRKVESDDFAYPVAIRISPYASMRDIIDFVEKTYTPFIKELQDRYKMIDVEIGKQRIRDVKTVARNNFIYENRRKARKVIMKLVAEKFDEFLDEGHISKIISHENKRRKLLRYA